MRRLLVALLVCAVHPAAAQVQSRPTEPPLVTAANESWYRLGEPIQFAGELYYLGGPAIFFNGNTMVRTGHYNGVPLYADATIEPFSVVFVPIGRGLMQPYERLRDGELAGTTGRRAPSLPVPPGSRQERAAIPAAAVAPTTPPQPSGALGVFTPELASPVPAPSSTAIVATAGAAAVAVPGIRPQAAVVIAGRPETNDGIWIQFDGERWLSAGPAVPLTAAEFVHVGDYRGFPVYARRDSSQRVIYLPTRPDLVAPYRPKR